MTRTNEYRSKTKVQMDMLKIVRDTPNCSKTRIMYGCYLSFQQLNKYLQLLFGLGLVDIRMKDNVYFLTNKGNEVLKLWEQIEMIMGNGV